MIRTSSYDNCAKEIYTLSISGDRGKRANYQGKCYPKLAPKLSFWTKWHDNIGKISEEENTRYYITEYYKEVLSKLDPEEVYGEINDATLLCYEPNNEFCHRHIVAAWFELLLDIKVPEQKINIYSQKELKRPENIKEYLNEIMIQNINMHGFTSLRAAYLFEKNEKFERYANELEEKIKTTSAENDKFAKRVISYRQYACYLRSAADMAEEEYKKEILKKRTRTHKNRKSFIPNE